MRLHRVITLCCFAGLWIWCLSAPSYGAGSVASSPQCSDIQGTTPRKAGLQLTVIPRLPTIRTADGRSSFGAVLVVKNVGKRVFAMDPGNPVVGQLVKPGTRHVVGVYTGVLMGTGFELRLAPNQTGFVDVIFGTGSCASDGADTLPPGRYGLRVVLAPEGVRTPTPNESILSPEARVRLTALVNGTTHHVIADCVAGYHNPPGDTSTCVPDQ